MGGGRRGQSVSERWLDLYMREDLSFIGRGLDFGPSFPVQQARTVRHGSPITRPIGAKIRAAAFLISPATFVKKSFSLGVFHAQSERSSLANRSVALESLPLSILTSGSQITATPPHSAHRIKPEYMR